MKLRYAIIRRKNAWILFRGDVELVSFPNLGQASHRARSLAMEMSLENGPVELLVQDAFGELRSESYADGALVLAAPAPLLRADLGGLHA